MLLRTETERRPSVRRGFNNSVSWVVTNIRDGGPVGERERRHERGMEVVFSAVEAKRRKGGDNEGVRYTVGWYAAVAEQSFVCPAFTQHLT